MPRPKTQNQQPRVRRATLQDIANIAGLHKVTVADALNGTGSVAPATREKVKQIAKELNYIPNYAARALSTGRTGTIAVLSGSLREPYYSRMVDLLEKQITAHGLNLMLMRTSNDVKGLVNATGNFAVDGVIAVDMVSLVNEFRSHPAIPCVSISTYEQSFVDNVIIDLQENVTEALQLMLSAGRQRIAYLVSADHMAQNTEVRARTYLSVMGEAARKPEIINVSIEGSVHIEAKFRAYIEEHGCPDALLCENDKTAMCAFRVFKALNYQVPTDVLLMGCDGLRHMQDFTPPLSTIALPMEEICATAWNFLEQRLAQPQLPHQVARFQGKLQVSESLVPPPPSKLN